MGDWAQHHDEPAGYSDFQKGVARPRSQGGAPVTVDSPEKQRGGIIDPCHRAPDQEWPGAEGAAELFFVRSRSGCDLATGAAPCERGGSPPGMDARGT